MLPSRHAGEGRHLSGRWGYRARPPAAPASAGATRYSQAGAGSGGSVAAAGLVFLLGKDADGFLAALDHVLVDHDFVDAIH